MGIIAKQSIRVFILSYLGVIIGFVNTSILYPRFLTTDMVGLFSLFLTCSMVIGDLITMGFNGSIIKLFPKFRNPSNGNNGLLLLGLMTLCIGFLIFLIIYYFASPYFIELNAKKSPLLSKYIYLFIPLTLLTGIAFILNAYSKANYYSVFPFFVIEVLQRLLIFSIILLCSLDIVEQETIIYGFAIAISLKTVIMFFYLVKKNIFHLKPNFSFITPSLRKEIISVSFFNIIGTLNAFIFFTIDKFFVNHFSGLSATGVYTLGFYFAALVYIPSKALNNVGVAFISNAWKENDLNMIENIYKKSCINQFLVGIFTLTILWTNIDSILWILGDDYKEARYIVLIIGISFLVDMSTGLNRNIILFSKYYKFIGTWILIMLFIASSIMYYFSSILGSIGTAIGVLCSVFIYDIVNSLFLYIKFKLHPFNIKFIIVLFCFVLFYLVTLLVPDINPLVNLITKSLVISILTLLLLMFYPVSSDISRIANKGLALLHIPITLKEKDD